MYQYVVKSKNVKKNFLFKTVCNGDTAISHN